MAADGGIYMLAAMTELSDLHRQSDKMVNLCSEVRILTDLMRRSPELAQVGLSDVAASAWENLESDEAELRIIDDQDIVADPPWLAACLTAIFENSILHSPGRPSVEVGVFDGVDGFYVRDDGPGIPPDRKDLVCRSGYSTADSGSGYGLCIVRHVASAHRWDLSLKQSESGGLSVQFVGVEFPDHDNGDDPNPSAKIDCPPRVN